MMRKQLKLSQIKLLEEKEIHFVNIMTTKVDYTRRGIQLLGERDVLG